MKYVRHHFAGILPMYIQCTRCINNILLSLLILLKLFYFVERLEDNIITSGLPLGSLWLRIERLREGIYFFPVEESSDPQRMVFREDLTQLLFPIAKSCESRLIMNTLLLLKVPPLPLTDAFYRFTKLDKIPWSLDCAEIILSPKCKILLFSQFKFDYEII